MLVPLHFGFDLSFVTFGSFVGGEGGGGWMAQSLVVVSVARVIDLLVMVVTVHSIIFHLSWYWLSLIMVLVVTLVDGCRIHKLFSHLCFVVNLVVL